MPEEVPLSLSSLRFMMYSLTQKRGVLVEVIVTAPSLINYWCNLLISVIGAFAVEFFLCFSTVRGRVAFLLYSTVATRDA